MASLLSILNKTTKKTLQNRSGAGNITWIAKKIKDAGNDKKFGSALPQIGQMFAYVYDAKHKATLPYWDKLPLVIPIEMYSDGFLGINFHYLPIKERTFLMIKLSALNDDDDLDNNTKLNLSYRLLAGLARYKTVKPTLHRYLYPHIKSKVIKIPPEDWFEMLRLPLAHFTGAGKTKVYRESKSKY